MNSVLNYGMPGATPAPEQDLLSSLAFVCTALSAGTQSLLLWSVHQVRWPHVGTETPNGIFSMNRLFGNPEVPGSTGWAPTAVQGLLGSFNAWMGHRKYKLAQEQFDESKRQFNLNYGAQRKLTNSQLQDRQRARVASNPNAYVSVSEYMDKTRSLIMANPITWRNVNSRPDNVCRKFTGSSQ